MIKYMIVYFIMVSVLAMLREFFGRFLVADDGLMDFFAACSVQGSDQV